MSRGFAFRARPVGSIRRLQAQTLRDLLLPIGLTEATAALHAEAQPLRFHPRQEQPVQFEAF
jgi:hypothetical protein